MKASTHSVRNYFGRQNRSGNVWKGTGTLLGIPSFRHRHAALILVALAVALTWFAAPGTALAAPPVFEEGATTTRSIVENTGIPNSDTPIGDPVSATDADGDELTYSVDLVVAWWVDGAGQIFLLDGRQRYIDHEEFPEIPLILTVSDGTNTDTITVTVIVTDVDEPPDAPEPPTVAAADSDGHSRLAVSWEDPGSFIFGETTIPPTDDYDLRYRINGSSDAFTDASYDGTETSASLTGLDLDTTYEVQVRASNDEGTGEWSDSGTGATDPAPLTFSTDAVSVDEGSTASYTVALVAQPTGAVTVRMTSADTSAVVVTQALVFTTENWDIARDVTVTGAADDDAWDEEVTLYHGATGGGYNDPNGGTVTVTVNDDDTAGLTFSDTTVEVSEESTATYTVVLDTRPSADVQITLTSPDTGAATVSPSPLIFTTTSWNNRQTVTVTGVVDDDAANETVIITHQAEGGDYGEVSGTVTAEVDDDDTAALTLSTASVMVTEESAATYTVKLATQPDADVEVTVTSSDTGAATILPSPLTFNSVNWNDPQTLTVTAVDDGDAADETVTLTHSASDGGYDSVSGTVTVNVTDNDTPGLILTPTGLAVSEGSTATYSVQLATLPDGDVTVTVTSGNTDAATVAPSPLTFTTENWNNPQTVTVTGEADDDTENETVTVTNDASGGGYDDISQTLTVTVADNELWSAVLTVGKDSALERFGYRSISTYGSLSPNNFTHEGTTYNINAFQFRGGDTLYLGFSPDITFKSVVTLIVGGQSFSASDATATSDSLSWADPGLTWAVGDTVNVALTATRPAAPAPFEPTPGDKQISLSWSDPSDSTITGYQIRQDDGAWTDISGSSATTTSVNATGLTNGAEYRLAVRAMVGTLPGFPATVVGVIPRTVPDAPGNVAAAPRDSVALLTWDAPASDGGAPITGYEWDGDGTTLGWRDVLGGAGIRSYRVTGLTNGQAYTLKVRAVNEAGEGAAASASAVTPAPVPAAATIAATRRDTEVTLSWTDPSDNTITEYQVRQDGGAWEEISGSTASTTSHTVTGLENGRSYSFDIRAVNPSGDGAVSNRESVTPAGLPLAPTGFSATGGSTVVNLRWAAADDNGSPITMYQYQQDDGDWTDIADSAPGGANAASFTVEGLTDGTVYTFKLRAVNGVGEGADSVEATATPQSNARPVAVGDLATTTADRAVVIDVLGNDRDPDPGDTIRLVSVTQPANGATTANPGNGTVTYQPDGAFTGVDTFTYVIRDRDGSTGSGRVRVLVWKPVATTDASNQSVQLIPPGTPITVETPGGDLVLDISISDPIQVRLDEDVSGCQSPVSGSSRQACVSVEIFDLGGGSTTSGVGLSELIIALVSSQNIEVYKRSDPLSPWVRIPPCSESPGAECFYLTAVDAGWIVTVRNIASFSQYMVVGPATDSQQVGRATVVRRRRSGGGARATATPAPTEVVVQATATPAPTPVVLATALPTAVPPIAVPTPVLPPTAVPPATAPPTAEPAAASATATPAVMPKPTATPAQVAALPVTIEPPTTAAPPSVDESGSGFPAWLIAIIAIAAVVVIGLAFGGWRLLRR